MEIIYEKLLINIQKSISYTIRFVIAKNLSKKVFSFSPGLQSV